MLWLAVTQLFEAVGMEQQWVTVQAMGTSVDR